jgi:hypothetical protein
MGLAEAQSFQVPLESVICTQELNLRPQRPTNFEALSRALVTLAQALATSPNHLLQLLVETALELCQSQSAGISLLEEENGRKLFRSHALAGQNASHLGTQLLAKLVPAARCWIRTQCSWCHYPTATSGTSTVSSRTFQKRCLFRFTSVAQRSARSGWPHACKSFNDGCGPNHKESDKCKIYLTANQNNMLKRVSVKDRLRAQSNSRQQNYRPIRFFGRLWVQLGYRWS